MRAGTPNAARPTKTVGGQLFERPVILRSRRVRIIRARTTPPEDCGGLNARATTGGTTAAGSSGNKLTSHGFGRSRSLTGHIGPVFSVAFAPDGHTLATGSGDNTVILWDVTGLNDLRNQARERACAITRGGLDRDEWDRYVRGLPYQGTCTA
jgi:WD40 repeat protein